jgi:hypothetical protein
MLASAKWNTALNWASLHHQAGIAYHQRLTAYNAKGSREEGQWLRTTNFSRHVYNKHTRDVTQN